MVSPTIQEAKSELAKKKWFAEIDLSNYFFEGGLRREDCAFLGVQHPYRGVYIYTASPQGLKNYSEKSYDCLARVYGDMIRDGKLTRMEDGIFPTTDSEEELLENYQETLHRAFLSGFTFKPSKTRIAPKSTVIFGWKLEDGKWSPQEHGISSIARSKRLVTIKQLRGFLGSYKQLSDTIKDYSILLSDLEKVVGSRGSSEKITWTDQLIKSFETAREAIRTSEGLYIPTPNDRLITSSDYSYLHKAVRGHLMIVRKNGEEESRLNGGHFSVKLDKHKSSWLACEGEALGVKLTVLHFENYIRENPNTTIRYTDIMPVAQAWRMMTTGKFSSNHTISSFLSTLSSFPIRVEHRPGVSMTLPDHASRNPRDCKGKCEICTFVSEEQSLGNKIRSVTEEGDISMEKVPFLRFRLGRTCNKMTRFTQN